MYNFSHVCLSVCETITFESLDVGSSYLHIGCISGQYGSSSYMKVIGSRSRSQESIRAKITVTGFVAKLRSCELSRYLL